MTTESPSTAPPVTELQTVSIEIKPALTEEEQKILSFVYETAKEFGTDIFNKAISNAMKVTQLIGSIIKMMESLTFNQTKIRGSTKKAVALELGRKLIHDLIKDETLQSSILLTYDATADATLEIMIDVSQHVNVAIKEAVTSCCEYVAEFLKKK